ncbi:MAG: DNA mismatch repair endonuclease MutL [Nitrospirae bacterium]|nr:DNA mismatch repair endonuclease MutL [Nitrospirota bacterium]
MPCINVLPLNLRNKIAAGEVVERPASVVKELIENSIDSGASRIEIDISRAGRRLIKVSDDGAGMDREDALIAFERYATSKIKDENDLLNIRTMGFRGEALSSIASVSKVRLITAARNMEPKDRSNPPIPPVVKGGGGGLLNQVGTCIEIIGGDVKEIKDCMTVGTTIEIKDLFFNMPARRKFLKSDGTENYHIVDTVTREALSHPLIGFVLRMDGDCALELPAAASYRERIVQVFGKEFADELIETGTEDGVMSVKAFLGKITHLRNNRNNQFFFINKRPVKDQSITYAVYKAYEGSIPKDKHPVFLLFMEMDPSNVDFNVHPTKREVRFFDKNSIFNFIHRTMRSAVSSQQSAVIAEMEIKRHGESEDFNYSFTDSPIRPFTVSQVAEPQELYNIGHSEIMPFLYLGDTFVAIPDKNGLTIIDYHAAHERINYERLLRRSAVSGQQSAVRLLFPQQVRLQGSEYGVILDNLKVLSDFGVEAEDFGHGTIIVRSIPDFLKDADVNSLVNDLANFLISDFKSQISDASESIETIDSIKKALAARLACHSSIRGKEIPDGMRIAQLLKDLNTMEDPNHCPHGRPTKILISANELRKMFKK